MAAPKAPGFFFYTNDYENDPGLRLCSWAAQGVFVRLLCYMAISPERGTLLSAKGKPLSDTQIVRWCGGEAIEVMMARSELLCAGVLAVREDGVWYAPTWQALWNRKPEGRLPWNLWSVIRERIFARDAYTCQYCGAAMKKMECDHVIPLSRGGSNEDENLVAACEPCNRSKRDLLPSEWAGA